jgi:ectoine hydroxylase-related dioxygenase (phytanoyl-CoA dioxygenase family)
MAVQTITAAVPLRSRGFPLDVAPSALGELRRSDDIAGDEQALRQRFAEDGYLYLPGYLDREEVLAARRAITDRLAVAGWLDGRFPAHEAVAASTAEGATMAARARWCRDSAAVQRLLYAGRMIAFYTGLLGGPVRHFDYTWMRAVRPGQGTAPHGDSVFMNRGTTELYTAWTPLGDISYELGGLIVLEGSHRQQGVKQDYGQRDVDTYCSNHADADQYASGEKWWNGVLNENPAALREQLGGRWLTTAFKAGDLLTFGMYTLHASLDNQSDRVRLSTDSRYQLASEAVDERWIGAEPIGHGPAGKRGQIC